LNSPLRHQPAALVGVALLYRQERSFSVFPVDKERLNTELTEPLRGLCVEAFVAQRTQRSV